MSAGRSSVRTANTHVIARSTPAAKAGRKVRATRVTRRAGARCQLVVVMAVDDAGQAGVATGTCADWRSISSQGPGKRPLFPDSENGRSWCHWLRGSS